MAERLCILGSTGSVGRSTLDVAARHPERIDVVALAARSDHAGMLEQIRTFRPERVALADPDAAARLRANLDEAGLACEVLEGPGAAAELIEDCDTVMAAMVGAAGLPACLSAARSGKRLLLANKEALVVAGRLLIEEVRSSDGELIPIDSEHNAIYQCLPAPVRVGERPAGVRRLVLTASGGPFLRRDGDLSTVTPEEACRHPNWDMGRKISVDSATMMNKGLELIEACLLFGMDPADVDVVVHPQSIVHSLVAFDDGSVLAQMAPPDMRIPIAHALGAPERIGSGADELDPAGLMLGFEAPDEARFPALALARRAAVREGGACALSAANEVAVQAFLDGRIRFTEIVDVVTAVFERVGELSAPDLEALLALDAEARHLADELVAERRTAAC